MNKHNIGDLEMFQSLPLDAKITMTKNRIIDWYEHWQGNVYIAFSGGKDSTVLKHIVDSLYNDIPSLYVDTGLEYPEIRQFAMKQKNVVIAKPKMNFKKILIEKGYPVLSKENSLYIRQARNLPEGSKSYNLRVYGLRSDGVKVKKGKIPEKYMPLIKAPFNVSEQCCDIMKKAPAKEYEKETNRKPIVGTMACESVLRKMKWIKEGCNAFEKNHPTSQPLSFWTESDILEYIKKYKVDYCQEVYGDITLINGKYETTKAKRTGCMFCMFGAHLEGDRSRFVQMKETHPAQYNFCMKPLNQGGLGMQEVIDYINMHCGTCIKY